MQTKSAEQSLGIGLVVLEDDGASPQTYLCVVVVRL
jgi:hypothetical protein